MLFFILEPLGKEIGMLIASAIAGIGWYIVNFIKNRAKNRKAYKIKGKISSLTQVSSQVDDLCVELRFLVKSNRVAVYQYHNGERFASKQPIWKMSCTNEKMDSKTKSYRGISQNLGVHLFTPLISEVEKNGIVTIHLNEEQTFNMRKFLSQRGVKTAAFKGLFDGNGNELGLIGIFYNDEKVPTALIEEAYYKTITEYADKITYILTT